MPRAGSSLDGEIKFINDFGNNNTMDIIQLSTYYKSLSVSTKVSFFPPPIHLEDEEKEEVELSEAKKALTKAIVVCGALVRPCWTLFVIIAYFSPPTFRSAVTASSLVLVGGLPSPSSVSSNLLSFFSLPGLGTLFPFSLSYVQGSRGN